MRYIKFTFYFVTISVRSACLFYAYILKIENLRKLINWYEKLIIVIGGDWRKVARVKTDKVIDWKSKSRKIAESNVKNSLYFILQSLFYHIWIFIFAVQNEREQTFRCLISIRQVWTPVVLLSAYCHFSANLCNVDILIRLLYIFCCWLLFITIINSVT